MCNQKKGNTIAKAMIKPRHCTHKIMCNQKKGNTTAKAMIKPRHCTHIINLILVIRINTIIKFRR